MKCFSFVIFIVAAWCCEAQRDPSIPLSNMSFRQIVRVIGSSPPGRSAVLEDIIVRHYVNNVTSPNSRRIGYIKQLLKDFDLKKPTVLYAHGYSELRTDESVESVMSSYIQRGDYNVLLLDWSNLAFGNYIIIAKTLPAAGEYVGRAFLKLLKKGLPLEGLHLVGHSLGCHLVGYIGRYLAARNFKVPRLDIPSTLTLTELSVNDGPTYFLITGLDPAFPGFYPPILAPPISPSDAAFVDIIHTDGGYYGTPSSTGHADFWPNGGQGKQPGCLPASILLTVEDFCSHWRSWEVWVELLNNSDSFPARKCEDYDMFLRGDCEDQPMVLMGVKATPDLRGNFYLRTAAKSPYGLGLRGIS